MGVEVMTGGLFGSGKIMERHPVKEIEISPDNSTINIFFFICSSLSFVPI
jgi:hypothetical protein